MLTRYSGVVGYMLVWSVVFLLAIPVYNQRLLSTCCLGTSDTPSVLCLVFLPPPLIQWDMPLAATVVICRKLS